MTPPRHNTINSLAHSNHQSVATPKLENHIDMKKTGSAGMCPFKNGMKNENPSVLRDVAAQIVRDHTFGDESLQKAEHTLLCALPFGDDADKLKTNVALGQVYVLMQRWGDAEKHLQAVVGRDPANTIAADLLKKAQHAINTGASTAMGSLRVPTKEELTASQGQFLRTPQGVLPLPKSTTEKPGIGARLFDWAADKAVSIGERVALRTAPDNDSPWFHKEWQGQKIDILGSLQLAHARSHILNGPALNSTYGAGLVADQRPGQARPLHTERFRTANGSWNTEDPMEGAAGTQFARTGAAATDRSRQNRMGDKTLPSPREISRELLATRPGQKRAEAPFLNAITANWIQFMTHDWMNHVPGKPGDDVYKIKLAADDPFRAKYGVEHLEVQKTTPDPMRNDKMNTSANEVTHWWDGSQVYGSDQATVDRLRKGKDGKFLADGKMRIDGDQLPVNPSTGVEDTGFARNWWLGLNMLHTTFVKHHNYICDELKKANPNWSSDQLFETARMVNAAVMAKIHTVEWTPAVLPGINTEMNTNWFGIIETMKKPHDERRVIRQGKPSDKVAGGIVGNARDNKGQPFAFSEEFVTDYLLGHPLMPDHIKLKPVNASSAEEISIENSRGFAARELMAKHGLTDLFNSFGNQKMPAIVNNNYPAFMSDMTAYGPSVMDLGATDIVRGRERGIPPYNEFRRQVGLKPIKNFEDLVPEGKYKTEIEKSQDPMVLKLKKLYGSGKSAVEKLDFHVGVLCEGNRPEFFGFGETQFHIFIQMASRRLESDPFYTDKFNARYYSQRGIELIEEASFKKILTLHYPELARSGLAGVNNAFEPWSSTAKEKPEEHPLTSANLEKY